MEQLRNFGDQRQTSYCTYCGGDTLTRDHVPSKVLLDEPYPDNLPVVPACDSCNQGFSVDEEYLACLIDCTLAGSPARVQRDKIRRILSEKTALAARLEEARRTSNGVTEFLVEESRVKAIIMKLARGHVLFELNEPHWEEPDSVSCLPISLLDNDTRYQFENLPIRRIWPEVGSRAMQRLAASNDLSTQWIIVQPGRYRYAASVDDGILVRMVLSEYLFCEVGWEY